MAQQPRGRPPSQAPPPAQRGQRALTFLGGGVLVLAVAGGAWALFGRDSSKDGSSAIGPKVPSVTATKKVVGPVVPGQSVAPARPTTKPASVKPSATATPAVAKPSSTAAPSVTPTKAAVAPTQAPKPTPTQAPTVSKPPVTAPQQGGTVTKKAFTFKVARGDTLWDLTKKALADTGRSTSDANVASYVTQLAAANSSIDDPDVIYVGQTISWPASL